jgi:hypothetical protein
MKKHLSLICITILLVGCSSNGIKGKYYYQSYSGGLDDDTYFELKDDGVCSMVASGEEQECTYGNGIITVGDQSVSYKISKNVMTVSFPGTDGQTMTFEKN